MCVGESVESELVEKFVFWEIVVVVLRVGGIFVCVFVDMFFFFVFEGEDKVDVVIMVNGDVVVVMFENVNVVLEFENELGESLK